MRGYLIVNILGKTQKAQSDSFLSSFCWHICHPFRVSVPNSLLCEPGQILKILIYFCRLSFFTNTYRSTFSISVLTLFLKNKCLLLANCVLGFMDEHEQNRTSPGPHRVSSPGGQTDTEALVPCAQSPNRGTRVPQGGDQGASHGMWRVKRGLGVSMFQAAHAPWERDHPGDQRRSLQWRWEYGWEQVEMATLHIWRDRLDSGLRMDQGVKALDRETVGKPWLSLGQRGCCPGSGMVRLEGRGDWVENT